jgi:5'-nucleotidase
MKEKTGLAKRVLLFDMDGVLCNYIKAREEGLERNPEQPYPQAKFGFFSNMEPIDGSIEAFRELEKHYDCYILTRPSTKNLLCYSEKAMWIRDYLGEYMLEKLIIACDKGRQPGDYLIDDMTEHGQTEFKGEHIHFGTEKFPDWASVVEYLEPVYDF